MMPWLEVLQWLGLASLLTFVCSLFVLPWLVGRLGADFFIRHRQRVQERHRIHPVLCIIGFVVRNAIGLLLLTAGLAMLLLPGQGILTILVAIGFLDIPGKFAMLEKLAQQPKVNAALQWIRKRKGVPPFTFSP